MSSRIKELQRRRSGQNVVELKTTPLTEVHKALGARMVDFAGFLMPVSYSGIIAEHEAVRSGAGVFDVSHMGQFEITGAGARDVVNEIITNDCSAVPPGGLQYTVMCRENGTVIDDLLVFVLSDRRLLLIVNASNIEKDFSHVCAFGKGDVEIRNVSDDYALLAVQGPRSRDVLRSCALLAQVKDRIDLIGYYEGISFTLDAAEILVSRTGYTGELGFEIFVPPALAKSFWNEILQAGRPVGIEPIGLGARDTLRFEASYCLYGHELDDDTSPLEAGLGWVVKLKKQRFCGMEALRSEKKRGPRRALVGLEVEGRNIARQGFDVSKEGQTIGRVTSGAFSPTFQKSLCMALIDATAKEDRGRYAIRIRDKAVPSALVPLPFYKSRAK